MITNMNQGACTLAQTPWSGAEARGFEPRKGANPNRISSVFPRVPGGCKHVRDGTETQARRAGKPRSAGNHTENARRVRTRNGHA